MNSATTLPNIHNFLDAYTIDNLPWYAIVIGTNNSHYTGLSASPAYRSIRNCSNIPLEILYYKLIERFQQPEFIDKYGVVPAHEDELLFVYLDKGVLRPIHRKKIKEPQNSFAPRDKRNSLVAADIKGTRNGDRQLTTEDKKDHLGILIRIMHRALDSMETKVSYRQIVSRTLDVIEEVVTGDVDNADIEKHETQIKNTWQRYFPTVPTSNSKKPKLAVSNNDKDE